VGGGEYSLAFIGVLQQPTCVQSALVKNNSHFIRHEIVISTLNKRLTVALVGVLHQLTCVQSALVKNNSHVIRHEIVISTLNKRLTKPLFLGRKFHFTIILHGKNHSQHLP